MIGKLQRRLVLITTGVIFIILFAVLGLSAYLTFYTTYVREMQILNYLCENEGTLPSDYKDIDVSDFDTNIRLESFFQLRYFSVTVGSDGETVNVDLSNIVSIDNDEAETMSQSVYMNGWEQGYYDYDGVRYVYSTRENEDGSLLVVFLDDSYLFESAMDTFKFAVYIAVGTIIVFMFVITALSRRALAPIIRNMENQKQFITNAGHELKTPVAVISANAEVLEMVNGKSEATDNILSQSERLTGLIDDLIALARVGETRDLRLEPIDCSPLAEDVVKSFENVAARAGKTLSREIERDVVINTDSHAVRELMNILVDNAVKYCDDGGEIHVELGKRTRTKGMKLTVSNTYADGEGVDYSKFFQRFYRADVSHNSSTSGYGIGLSMATELVKSFKGKIIVDYHKGMVRFTVTV